ncbi:unnamed protein product [Merluccius merluccius]
MRNNTRGLRRGVTEQRGISQPPATALAAPSLTTTPPSPLSSSSPRRKWGMQGRATRYVLDDRTVAILLKPNARTDTQFT